MYSSREDNNILLFKSMNSLTIFAWLQFFPFLRNLDPFKDKWLMSCFVDISNDLRKRKWNGQIFIEIRSHSKLNENHSRKVSPYVGLHLYY